MMVGLLMVLVVTRWHLLIHNSAYLRKNYCSHDMNDVQICPAQAITIEAEEREDGSRRTTR
jgi:NADH dehydrogenase (ubiquinone) Fe-S protein 8